MFLTVYRVTQKDFYAHPYTSMWGSVVDRQISKRYSSSCHVLINTWQEHAIYQVLFVQRLLKMSR
jgi:hypothetical protein